MGTSQSIQKVNYEDIQTACGNNDYMIISTISNTLQLCLIKFTIACDKEEELLNTLMKTNKNMKIIIYGLNSNDETIYTKYYHLQKCGFTRVYIYTGGLFEWLCLQDIYGDDSFATTQSELDILKYKPKSCLNRHTITDYPHNL
jgi:hypothetical protein